MITLPESEPFIVIAFGLLNVGTVNCGTVVVPVQLFVQLPQTELLQFCPFVLAQQTAQQAFPNPKQKQLYPREAVEGRAPELLFALLPEAAEA